VAVIQLLKRKTKRFDFRGRFVASTTPIGLTTRTTGSEHSKQAAHIKVEWHPSKAHSYTTPAYTLFVVSSSLSRHPSRPIIVGSLITVE
jgi:hypothetical protein